MRLWTWSETTWITWIPKNIGKKNPTVMLSFYIWKGEERQRLDFGFIPSFLFNYFFKVNVNLCLAISKYKNLFWLKNKNMIYISRLELQRWFLEFVISFSKIYTWDLGLRFRFVDRDHVIQISFREMHFRIYIPNFEK
jgi:hypothetical protein